jgi:hypothetical protein
MNDNELKQLEIIGADYRKTLAGLVDEIRAPEGQAHFLAITFSAIVEEFIERRGPIETAAFLQRASNRVLLDAQRVLQ